ncbi:MAG: SemiSWEET family transporter [Acidimicrobiales bacterium]
MFSIEIVATVYGVFMSLAPLLQAKKMWIRKSSEDVSIPYLVVLVVGFSLYLLYGISISNRLLISTNVVSILATAATLAIAALLRPTVVVKP